jgi:DNA-binding GntR family transcriptional regulator
MTTAQLPDLPPLTAVPEDRQKTVSSLGPVRQRALRESVFEALLTAIVRGEMKPGSWSNHQHLAERLQVSITPLREALQELAACGIVENQHNRGTVVRPFGPTQLFEIFYVRSLLESEATRLACPQVDQAALTKIRSQISGLMSKESSNWDSEVIAEDEDLHRLIAASCGNQRLKEEIYRYRSLLSCIRRAVAGYRFPFKLALPEHLAITEALLNQQSEEAAKAMTRHILSAAQVCSGVLFPEVKEKN